MMNISNCKENQIVEVNIWGAILRTKVTPNAKITSFIQKTRFIFIQSLHNLEYIKSASSDFFENHSRIISNTDFSLFICYVDT